MPDESGRPELLLESEERASREAELVHPGGPITPPEEPHRGLHLQDEFGLRISGGTSLRDALNGSALIKTTDAQGRLALTAGPAPAGASTDLLNELAAAVSAEEAAREAADSALAAEIAAISGATGLDEATVLALIQANSDPRSKTWPLGTIASGATVTPDLRKGRVFIGTPAGTWKLKPPSNPPATPTDEALFAEVVFIGEHPPTIEGIALEGEPLQFDLTAGVENAIPLISRDNGATWKIIGDPKLPADVPRIVGSPADGEALLWDAELEAWAPGTVVTEGGGLSEEAIDGLIVDHIANEATRRLDVTDFLTASTSVAINTLARVAKSGIVLTFPTTELLADGSGRIMVQNLSTGPCKLKGKFTLEHPKTITSTTEVLAGETVTFIVRLEPEGIEEGGGVVWIKESVSGRTTAELEALVASLALKADPYAQAAGLFTQSTPVPSSSAPLINERLHLVKVMVPFTREVKEIVTIVTGTKATSLTLGEAYIFAGPTSNGTPGALLGKTANEATKWEKLEAWAGKVTGSPTITGGPGVFVYVGFLAVGTGTMPTFASLGGTGVTGQTGGFAGRARDLNANLIKEELRAAIAANNAAVSSAPASITPSENYGKVNDVALFYAGLK